MSNHYIHLLINYKKEFNKLIQKHVNCTIQIYERDLEVKLNAFDNKKKNHRFKVLNR